MSERETAWGGGIMPLRHDDVPTSGANLSRLITNLNNVGAKRPFQALLWRHRAGEEAKRLYRVRTQLDYNALNVLSYWFVRIGRVQEAGIVTNLGIISAENAYEQGVARPHQLALAYAVRALWAVMGVKHPSKELTDYVLRLRLRAEMLEEEIDREPDRLQALRQFVRVLKDFGKVAAALEHYFRAQELFRRALFLAEGEAKTESQAAQLRALIKNTPKDDRKS